MSELKIKVGASVDRNLQVAYRPLVDGAKRAAAAINAEAKKSAAAQEKEAKKAAQAQSAAYAKAVKEIERWQREGVRSAEKSSRDAARAVARAARDEVRAHEQAEKEKSRATAREAAARTREIEKAMRANAKAARAQHQMVTGALTASGRAAMGIGRTAAGAAFGIAGAIARGSGVDLDFQSMVSKNTDLESLATRASNSGFIAGDKRNGERVDPRLLKEQAFAVGKATGTDANEVMEGLERFMGITGDLTTGRQILQDMAVLSKATGANLGDMMSAAGQVSAALGDIPDKEKVMAETMRAFAGQGKVGAIEIKDLANQMAGLAAVAGSFSGDKATTLAELGAIAQESRSRGGSKGPAQAVTSVQSFAMTFDKGAREKAFAKFGVKTRDERGFVRDPMAVIKEAMLAASKHGMKDFSSNMGQMFADARARSATRGFENIYKDAGGGAAGIAAVQEEFERLRRAAIEDAEVMESFRAAMATSEAQAAVFNDSLRESADKVTSALTPALVALAPSIVEATKAAAGFTAWVLGHEAELKGQQKANEGDIAGDIKETNKQIGAGYVFDKQKKKNERDENEARRIALQREQDYKDLKANRTGKLTRTLVGAAEEASPTAWLMRLLTGTTGGDQSFSVRHYKKQDEGIGQSKESLEKSRASYQQIAEENKKVHDLLANGTISVRVVEPLPAVPGPPTGDGDGRQPSPDKKRLR